jgi:hemerythrin-like domain-containing protein
MDALSLLEQDHKAVRKLLEDIDATTERAVKTRGDLIEKLRGDLEAHESIEEEIFYPALKEHPKARDITLEGYEEHHVVDTVMAEIMALSPNDEVWTAKFTVMKENLEHHIEEEEGDMFKIARQVFEEGELNELGARMDARKREILAAS